MRTLSATLPILAVCASWGGVANAQPQSPATFDVYVIDVEGGEATLFVSPSGESMLVDTGWPGFDGRDADRIAAAAKLAGITQIDYLVVTHFHADHMGGAAQLQARLPIRRFIDHGRRCEAKAYTRLHRASARRRAHGRSAGRHDSDRWSRRARSSPPVDASCRRRSKAAVPRTRDAPVSSRMDRRSRVARGDAEDSRSVSLSIAYGRFRTVIMGDLNWNKEFDLMCPDNKLGTVDVYLVSHHGSELRAPRLSSTLCGHARRS